MKNLVKPTGFRIVLFFTFLVPLFMAIGFLRPALLAHLLATIVSGYLLACLFDYFVKNRNVKIVVASVSALVSVIWIYLISRVVTEAEICDPVHEPSQCELACRKIIENAANVTDEVLKKFNECVQNCYK
ncbi:MAG: hypothetical protein GXO63_00350 [Candidatus Micrarchaeota archaeon]|nr:hypothetical protein [Candidatus Micrarchaeota archaeon]